MNSYVINIIIGNTSISHCLQGIVQYQVIGDIPAPVFFDIDANTGRLYVRSNLKLDTAVQYLVSVVDDDYRSLDYNWRNVLHVRPL